MSTAATELEYLDETILDGTPPCQIIYQLWPLPETACGKPSVARLILTCGVHGPFIRFLCNGCLVHAAMRHIRCGGCPVRVSPGRHL